MDNKYLKKQADEIEKIYYEYMVEMKKLRKEQDRIAAKSVLKKIQNGGEKKYGK
ncbi:MAG: hypothetical protein PHT16_04130 [Candidatus Pacebacteria bacterium]|nr:hypothetical protein [Candidatus Paceibacterota bacterium]